MLRPLSLWQRLGDFVFSTEPRRRALVRIVLLSLVLMTASAAVMLMAARASDTINMVAVQWWAAMSVGGLVVMAAIIRSGMSVQFADPSLTLVQMVWTITSGAVAYVLAGEARGLVPSVLVMILFFGTFSLTVPEVVGVGIYAALAFVSAIGVGARFNSTHLSALDTAYALMVFIVLGGSIALNLRIHRIRERLREKREALAEALRINQELASHDELTGLLNRRAMWEMVAVEHRRSMRTGRPLLLAQLDIDHFKAVNDTHGHATGDRALQAFANVVRACVRDTDVLARWGGEEFVLMIVDTDCEHARNLLERIRLAVAGMEIPHATGMLRMTVSAGLAHHQPGDTIDHTLERADQALYTAKALGRNRVSVAPPARSLSARRSGG